MTQRLVVITEIIAPYRIPVFNALSKQPGIDLHVIFLAETDPALREWLVYKDELQFSYQVLRSWRMKLGTRKILLNWGLNSALRKLSPDAIICGGYNDFAYWNALRWSHRKNVPFFVWVESNAQDQRGKTKLVQSLKGRFLRASRGVVVSGKSSANYVKTFGVAETVIFTAPNAVDNALFTHGASCIRKQTTEKRRELELPERYFLYVGRLVREKGIFDLLEAYALLSPDLRQQMGLVFVGDGSERALLEERASKIVAGSIVFSGFVHRDELIAYYAMSDIFAFPTHSDPWGLAVNEAMACGLPIVITQVAGCAEDLVLDRWNGRVVLPRNPSQLAEAMKEVAGDSNLQRLMGQRSLERIGKYSPELCAVGMAQAIYSCCDDHDS